MLRIAISWWKAKAICQREGLPYSLIKQNGPFLLQTGAKLGWSAWDRSYVVSGYSYDGSGVKPYQDNPEEREVHAGSI